MTRIIINNIAQLKAFNKKLRAVTTIIPTLKKTAAERAADESVLTGIHRDMETNEFSKKIIDRTFVGDISIQDKGRKITVEFISDYVSDDVFDVSNAREEGTRDHDVFPKKSGGWLSYIDKKTGKRVFRKHTHPSGIKRLLIIESNIHKNKEAFKNSYESQIAASLNQVLTV